MAKTPTQETTTSKNTKHARPSGQSVPDSMPRYGGKMRLPAPKNMANSAKPTTSASLFTGASLLMASMRVFAHLLSMNEGAMMVEPFRAAVTRPMPKRHKIVRGRLGSPMATARRLAKRDDHGAFFEVDEQGRHAQLGEERLALRIGIVPFPSRRRAR